MPIALLLSLQWLNHWGILICSCVSLKPVGSCPSLLKIVCFPRRQAWPVFRLLLTFHLPPFKILRRIPRANRSNSHNPHPLQSRLGSSRPTNCQENRNLYHASKDHDRHGPVVRLHYFVVLKALFTNINDNFDSEGLTIPIIKRGRGWRERRGSRIEVILLHDRGLWRKRHGLKGNGRAC